MIKKCGMFRQIGVASPKQMDGTFGAAVPIWVEADAVSDESSRRIETMLANIMAVRYADAKAVTA